HSRRSARMKRQDSNELRWQQRERREVGESPPRRSSSPGKRTRTMSLPPRPAGAPGSVQQRRGPATAAARAMGAGGLAPTAGAAPIDAFMDAAVRGVVAEGAAELLYAPTPVQAKVRAPVVQRDVDATVHQAAHVVQEHAGSSTPPVQRALLTKDQKRIDETSI